MGLSELIAVVVSGIESPVVAPTLLGDPWATAGAAACGVAAVVVLRLMNAVNAMAKMAVQNTIFHRIRMKPHLLGCGMNHIPRGWNAAT
jgi:hypothetical protein